MRASRVLMASVVAQAVLLGALLWVVGAGIAGAAVGVTCGVLGWTVLARTLAEHGRAGLGPADHVTITRGALACVVAALTIDAALAASADSSLVLIASVALVLDAVDGWVARRTRTTSALGARLDMEVDAFLILVLSVAASGVLGWWVLATGAFRYLLLVATWALPWLGGAVPPRYWRKAVAALQGVVLTLAVARVLPDGGATGAVVLALALLAWSFGTQVVALWRTRASDTGAPVERRILRRPDGAADVDGAQPVRVLR